MATQYLPHPPPGWRPSEPPDLDVWEPYSRLREDAAGSVPNRLHLGLLPGEGPGGELLGPLRHQTAVDLGCGTGTHAAHLAVYRGAKVTGVDSSAAMIQEARRCARDGETRLAYAHVPAQLYLADRPQAHDLVLSVFGACDFTDPHKLLPLLVRSLRPRGRLILSTLQHDWEGNPPETHVKPRTLTVRGPGNTSAQLWRWTLEAPLWHQLLDAHGLDVTSSTHVHAGQGPSWLVLSALLRPRSLPGPGTAPRERPVPA